MIGIQKRTGKVRKIKPLLHLHCRAPVSKKILPTIWWEIFQKDLYILIWKTFKNSLVLFFKRYLQSLIYIIFHLWKWNGILLPKLFGPTVRKNCSSDWEKLLKLEAEGWEFAKLLRSLEQFIRTVKGQTNFRNRMVF